MSELDPITGPANTTLTLPVLAERVAMERALREQAQTFIEKALQLQAEEYERRLESLNGEASRLAKVLDQSVPREVFEQYKETQQKAGEIVANTLSEERGARASQARLVYIILAATTILTFTLNFIIKPQA